MDDDLNRVVFHSCTSTLDITAYRFRGAVWWRISAPDLPDRWLRLQSAKRSVQAMIDAYAYMDGDMCVNSSQDSTTKYRGPPVPIQDDPTLSALSDEQLCTTGVPQRAHNSGLCWYSALCFAMLFSKQMRSFLGRYMPDDLESLCAGVLSEPARAEALRAHLYNTYAVGDRPNQPPEKDGQNGASQLLLLLAQLGAPTRVLFAPEMEEVPTPLIDKRGVEHALRRVVADEPALLVVRAFRTAWTPKRRLLVDGRRYKLVAMLIGSEYCGHQIGASTVDMRVNRWALADADACKHGIGPMFWTLRRAKKETRAQFRTRWREMWKNVLPITRFGFGKRDMCHFNPAMAQENEEYARALKRGTPTTVNTDYLYLSSHA